MNPDDPSRIDRRIALKWMLTAAAGLTLARQRRLVGEPPGVSTHGAVAPAVGNGYGTDPNLLKPWHPGDLWPLTLTEGQRRTAAVLCDVIIPADGHSPGAASLGVHDFIDEWISAPYADCVKDRPVIVDGLEWLEAESRRRFGEAFVSLSEPRQRAICDDICREPASQAAFRKPAHFFRRFRDLAAGGFYTTPEGVKDLGYVGNIPSGTFEGPPRELLEKLGLA